MLVDGDFLAKLIGGSYEVAMGGVEEAVQANAAEAFGDSNARTIATYPDHFIVATPAGDFFRGKWDIDEESGSVVLSDINTIEVPVYEASAMGTQIRQDVSDAVDLLLQGNEEEADDKLRYLFSLTKNGTQLTAEGVEDLHAKQSWSESDWFAATRDNDSEIRKILGTDVLRFATPKPRFESITGDIDEDEAERHRMAVTGGLRRLHEYLQDLWSKLNLAVEVTEEYSFGSGDGEMAVADYVDYVQDFVEDLNGMTGILGDALAVADDGCVPCLARVHDKIAENMYEWAMAAAFAEKLARRFEAPQAA